jgi:hypothetical protein
LGSAFIANQILLYQQVDGSASALAIGPWGTSGYLGDESVVESDQDRVRR